MNESEFSRRYQEEIPIYRAWGDAVNQEITRLLRAELTDGQSVELFLKMPPAPRTKELKSIIDKAFYRNKPYKNPYDEITDKVGVRYVVLVREDIRKVEQAVTSSSMWRCSKDRDFEAEIAKSPLIFDYQSVHYIVRNKTELEFGGVAIPAATPCEVQIRTLLQHAYAELTHDAIYKPKTTASPKVHRMAAKSMALIETTDDIFVDARRVMQEESATMSSLATALDTIYGGMATAEYQESLNLFVLDAYRELLDQISLADVEAFVRENPNIRDIIKRQHDNLLLYRQPIVLFIMYLIMNRRNALRENWPLTDSELRPLFSDLGISFES